MSSLSSLLQLEGKTTVDMLFRTILYRIKTILQTETLYNFLLLGSHLNLNLSEI